MHYFFLAGYTFMLLESLQTLAIVGNIIPSGPMLSKYVNAAIGWGGSGPTDCD